MDKMKSEVIDILNFRLPMERPSPKRLHMPRNFVGFEAGMENFKSENSPNIDYDENFSDEEDEEKMFDSNLQIIPDKKT